MSELKSKKPSRCPVCGRAELRRLTRTEHFEYEADHEKIQVKAGDVPVEVCDACGETFSGPDAWRIRDEAICRALGLLTPREIRALREQLGLTQAELARVTGIGEASISRWERGQLIQSRALDRYLRLLAANRENVKLLESVDGARNGLETGLSSRKQRKPRKMKQ